MKYILTLGLAACLFSCEDFLDKEPLSLATPEDYYQSADQLQAAVNALYEGILPSHGSGVTGYGTFATDRNTDNQAYTSADTKYAKGQWKVPMDESGNWNWDTFKSLATGLAKEKTAGGEAITAFSSWDTTLFLKANNTGFIKWEGTDYKLNLDDSKLREALNYFKELCTTGAFTGWQGWSQADFQLGTSAMIVDRFGNKTHFVSDLTFDWDFVPVPTGYSGDENVAPGTIATYGIPAGSNNPTGGAAYIYLFCKQDYDRRKEYLANYLSDEQIERFESLYSKISRTYETIGLNNTDELIWEIADGADVTSTLEAYKTKWQGELDTYTAGLKK